MRQRFRKADRIVSDADFAAIIRQGCVAADDTLVAFARVSAVNGVTRLGVTIPKKVGCAVVRNRWKRWIREAFRQSRDNLPNGYDIVIRPKRGAEGSWNGVRKGMPRLIQRSIRRASQSKQN